MTKLVAMPIYDKNFSRTVSSAILKVGMQRLSLKLYNVYINDDLVLTKTYFTARSYLVNFKVGGNCRKVI